MRPRTLAGLTAALLLCGSGAAAARTIPDPAPELPILHEEAKAGTVVVDGSTSGAPVAARTIDGHIDDWTGTATDLGGTAVYSRGELVYTDHLFDAYGADDGGDAQRLAVLDPLNKGVPETYRLDPIFQADLPGEFGVPTPAQAKAEEQYGDLDYTGPADLTEVRLAADGTSLYLLARTATMTAPDQTAVVVLLDTVPGSAHHEIPFGAGIASDTADVAVLLASGRGRAVDLATGAETPVTVAADATGWTNAIEASVPLSLLGGEHPVGVAAASGLSDPATGGVRALANVAFRSAEPVRTWFDKSQALTLGQGTIDPFFTSVDPAALRVGRTDAWHAGPGYFDKVFTSSEAISSEGGMEGIRQHYGLFIPTAYGTGAAKVPLTFWLHWRGGKAHSAAAVSPRVMRDFGENAGTIVAAPRGRGSSSWYLGRGQVDLDEVYADVTKLFAIDLDHVNVTGHSMGGWGSWLEAVLHPDRFAAALPVEGPLTQGAWTGLDFPNCDQYKYSEYTFCYVETNDSNPRTQHTLRMMANLRNTPIAVWQGAIDELVPVSGVTRQMTELANLGYRYRYYLFPNYEHYSHPVVDEWAEGARFFQAQRRDPNPARVTYRRDMPFERSVESGANQHDTEIPVQLDFDHAYWMSELTPVNLVDGVAIFDGVTLARPATPTLTVPEAGGPASVGQVGPYVMTGQKWVANPLASAPAAANGFEITVSGASAVRLDLVRMGIDPSRPITAKVTTDTPLEVRLGTRTVLFPSGTSEVTI
ncbi:MAG: hypothetical protein QOJ09_2567 [Actinomycetota bacterium]|nr:hypothetical protein [Actinomycetota bacterium]